MTGKKIYINILIFIKFKIYTIFLNKFSVQIKMKPNKTTQEVYDY